MNFQSRAAFGAPSIIIIGAGMSGMCMAIRLLQAGLTNFRIFEKSSRVGGTWRENTYPGLICDVPSHLYCYSFHKNPDWTRRYSTGAEIQDYFVKAAKDFGIEDFITFGKEVKEAVWGNGQWTVSTEDGQRHVADVLISAVGFLHHPAYPEIAGLDEFAGPILHSTRWDHTLDLSGKLIGIIGTGSTSTQLVPELSAVAQKLCVFQRTPQWVFPLPNKLYSERFKKLLRRFPWLQDVMYGAYKQLLDMTFARVAIGGKISYWMFATICARHLRKGIADPELRRKLTPNYKATCKRLVLSSLFYPAIQRSNVELVTDTILRVTKDGVQTTGGEHGLDVLVLATGFKAHNYLRPIRIVGEGGITIDEAWSKGNRAYVCITVPRFPNLFMIVGPHSPIANFAITQIAEAQTSYILQCIRALSDGGRKAMAPREEAAAAFDAELREAMKKTIWVTGGCKSWYIDEHGQPTAWPFTPERFYAEMRTPKLDQFHMTDLAHEEAGAVAE
jgi:cation diffusion facilitator CzcD-associated flavoprotein CzcO